MKKGNIKLLVVFSILMFALLFNSSSFSANKYNEKIIKITTPVLRFRVEPWGKQIGVVTEGSKYKVYSSRKDNSGAKWYRIKSNGKYGYVYAEKGYTKIVSVKKVSNKKIEKTKSKKVVKKSNKYIKITTPVLRFRVEPWGKQIGVVTEGSKYKVYGSKKDNSGAKWYRIKSNGKYGYVYAGAGYTKVINTKATPNKKIVKTKSKKVIKKSEKYIIITTPVLRFRTEPWGRHIGNVEEGYVYLVRGTKKDSRGNLWYKIKSKGKYGYVYAGAGYTNVVNEYTKKHFKKRLLSVPLLSQRYPYWLPMGCEGTAFTMAIKYKGQNRYNQKEINSMFEITGDPRTGFMGSPFYSDKVQGTTPTIWPKPLIKSLKKVYSNVEDISGCSLNDIIQELNNGNPIIFWYARGNNKKVWTKNGYITNNTKEHCVTLIGHDKNNFYVNDPWYGRITVSKSYYYSCFIRYGRKAVVVR